MTYQDLLEDCKQIYTELSYSSRFVRISMFHLIGKQALESNLDPEKINSFACAVGITPEDLGAAILFAHKYPDIVDFNHDKTISWEQIKREITNDSL